VIVKIEGIENVDIRSGYLMRRNMSAAREMTSTIINMTAITGEVASSGRCGDTSERFIIYTRKNIPKQNRNN